MSMIERVIVTPCVVTFVPEPSLRMNVESVQCRFTSLLKSGKIHNHRRLSIVDIL